MKPIERQTILITGATDGIGRGTAEALARLGATVLIHGRNAERLSTVCEDIASRTGNARLETFEADFTSLADVRRLANEVAAAYQSLDVLINNAGIGRGPKGKQHREVSSEGHELRFQVNHLAPFLLQHLLLPLLENAAPARIVNVASAGQRAIDFDDVMLERRYDGVEAYCQSKLAMIMGTFELARRLDAAEVTVNALHPGTLLDTKIVREGFGEPLGPVEIGIEAESYLAAAPDLDGVTGEYFDRTQRARANGQAYDLNARAALWRLSKKLTGLTA